jgi:hypothetical protein
MSTNTANVYKERKLVFDENGKQSVIEMSHKLRLGGSCGSWRATAWWVAFHTTFLHLWMLKPCASNSGARLGQWIILPPVHDILNGNYSIGWQVPHSVCLCFFLHFGCVATKDSPSTICKNWAWRLRYIMSDTSRTCSHLLYSESSLELTR